MSQSPRYIIFNTIVGLAALSGAAASCAGAESLSLSNNRVQLVWEQSAQGWKLTRSALVTSSGAHETGTPSGEYMFIFSADAPSTGPVPVESPSHPNGFPEPVYARLAKDKWPELTKPVAMNMAGDARHFFPGSAQRRTDGAVMFAWDNERALVRATWSLGSNDATDVLVDLTLEARQRGFYSISTPTVSTLDESTLAWGIVPGCYAGSALNPDFVMAFGYGHGLPARPVLSRERSVTTLMSALTHRNGTTLSVIAEPGTAADPWRSNDDTRQTWRLGLSHMNRRGALSPTLYHPVLAEEGSFLEKGESVRFRFRYHFGAGGWPAAIEHAAYNVYRLEQFLTLKEPRESLNGRLRGMRRFVSDDETSMWRTEEYNGRLIGAQAYLGTVLRSDRSDRDAIKNSDYGAMWMLARLTQDPKLLRDRLPQARAFKLEQQQAAPGFFQGAATGQYYLMKSDRFSEEFGDYVEPVALTYYTLCDLGNILLFSPDDAELRERLRLGADRLLQWQHADGHWDFAYDHATKKTVFPDLPDYRPTFYGLLIAYRTLGDGKYLAGARRGADWLVRNAVDRHRYVGVCGDARFPPDFAIGQISQGLLELHAITGEPGYREAAIRAGLYYLTFVFTHPIASREPKLVHGGLREDWEISQVGLSYEHGGAFGSANTNGPILLASHAGWFMRMFGLTGNRLFRDLARASVWARHAFVDSRTSVASYYWKRMDDGPGRFPHHAWWQIGWIMDYLISEAEIRSSGRVSFPRGYFTPKVGPHGCFGFAPGTVFGERAELGWGEGIEVDRPEVDWLMATSTDRRRHFVILLNDSLKSVTTTITCTDQRLRATRAELLAPAREAIPLSPGDRWSIELPAAGMAVISLYGTRTTPAP